MITQSNPLIPRQAYLTSMYIPSLNSKLSSTIQRMRPNNKRTLKELYILEVPLGALHWLWSQETRILVLDLKQYIGSFGKLLAFPGAPFPPL